MKSLSRLTAIALVLSLVLAANYPTLGYTIEGAIQGLPDGTWLYLRTNEPIDSCQVNQGKFRMRGHIEEPAIRAYLYTKNFSNYVSFWLENTTMTISLKAGAFKKGSITGSATQDENRRLTKLHEPIDYQIDSLNKLWKVALDTAMKSSLQAQLQLLDQQSKQIDRDWIKTHSNSLFAADLLNISSTSWGKAVVQPLYDKLSPAMKATRYGREIKDYLILYKKIKIGDTYVDFEQPNPVGKLVRLSAIKEKYTLLDFWATWCGPCLKENQLLKEIYVRYKDKGFTVLGVSLDNNKAGWLKVIAGDQLPWENVTDLRGDKNVAALMYGISGIPDNFLLDENGTIIARNLHGKELEDKLKQLMP